jgi:haloalkane dehalogenase
MSGAAFDFEPHFVEVAGHRMHYLDEGDGDPIVFLHGNPQWTYGWRNVVPLVSPVARVIAPDMIGMGRSDKPDIPYSFFLHLGYLDRFLDALALDRYVLAVHDWGSALGLSLAMRRPEQVRAMVLMETFTVNATMVPAELQADPVPWMDTIGPLVARFVDPVEGPRLVLEEDAFNDTVQVMTKRTLSDEEMAGYRSAYPTPESRRAQLAWVFNAVGPEDKILGNHVEWRHHAEFLVRTEFPKLVLHCREGMITDANVGWYRDHLSNVEVVSLGDGYHYVQEDQPEALGNSIARWLPGLPA